MGTNEIDLWRFAMGRSRQRADIGKHMRKIPSNKSLHLPSGYLSPFLHSQECRQILVASKLEGRLNDATERTSTSQKVLRTPTDV